MAGLRTILSYFPIFVMRYVKGFVVGLGDSPIYHRPVKSEKNTARRLTRKNGLTNA